VRPPSKENMMEKLAALDKLGFSSSKWNKTWCFYCPKSWSSHK
jgi:hypothetical protein